MNSPFRYAEHGAIIVLRRNSCAAVRGALVAALIFTSWFARGSETLPADLSTLFPPKPAAGSSYSQAGTAQAPPAIYALKENPIGQEMIDHHSGVATKLLTAIKNGDFEAFVFWGTPKFKAYKPEAFQEKVSRWRPLLGGGWSVAYLGELKTGRFVTTVWRVRIFGDPFDRLMTLTTDQKGSVEVISLYD